MTVLRGLLLLNFSCIVPVEKDVGDVVRLQRRVAQRRNAPPPCRISTTRSHPVTRTTSSEEGAIKVLSFDTALGNGGPERGRRRFLLQSVIYRRRHSLAQKETKYVFHRVKISLLPNPRNPSVGYAPHSSFKSSGESVCDNFSQLI